MNTTDIIFVVFFQIPKDQEPKLIFRGENHTVTRWTSVYGSQEDAYRGAATFIRDMMVLSNLRSNLTHELIQEIEEAIRKGDIETVISSWNDEMTQYKVKIYKGTVT
jgi:transcriptional regulator CtsR